MNTHLESGLAALESGNAVDAALHFRAALAEDMHDTEAHYGLIRALRDANMHEQSVAAALALTALEPNDPLAHTTLSISLQHAGMIEQAEAASARARILEWKQQLATPEETL